MSKQTHLIFRACVKICRQKKQITILTFTGSPKWVSDLAARLRSQPNGPWSHATAMGVSGNLAEGYLTIANWTWYMSG